MKTIIRKTFWKHSSCFRSIRGVHKAYGTQHLQIIIPNAPRYRRMLPGRFPYMPYAPRMLPEYFPNTYGRHIRMVDDNYFEHAQHIFGPTECCFICIRTEPNRQYDPRTHRMRPEYDPFAPRTPKFIFGKQTKWHSGKCDRAIIKVFNLAQNNPNEEGCILWVNAFRIHLASSWNPFRMQLERLIWF